MIHHLHRGEESAVIQHDKAKLLAGPYRPDPAAYSHFFTGIGICVFEQLSDRNQIHRNKTLSLAENIAKYTLNRRNLQEQKKIFIEISEKIWGDGVTNVMIGSLQVRIAGSGGGMIATPTELFFRPPKMR